MSYHANQSFSLFFVRHGVTDVNFRGLRCGGDLDIPLTDIGCDQAYLLAKQIKMMDLDIGLIVCSSLIRVQQTALIINGVLGNLQTVTDPSFNERLLGDWNMKSIADTEQDLASGVPPPGGESDEQFQSRVEVGVERINALLPRRPLVVSSKGVGRMLNTILGGAGRLVVGNGEIVEFAVRRDPLDKLFLDVRRPHQV